MLTARTYKGWETFFRLIQVTGAVPFEWSKESREMHVTHRKRRLLFWMYNIVWQFTNFLLVSHCFVQGLFGPGERHVSKLVIDLFFILGYGTIVIFHINLVLHRESMAQFITEFHRVDRKYTGEPEHVMLCYIYPVKNVIRISSCLFDGSLVENEIKSDENPIIFLANAMEIL